MRIILSLIVAILLAAAIALPWLITPTESESDASADTSQLTQVPEVEIKTEVPDFNEIRDVRAKKEAFFSFLMPAVKAENIRILLQREELSAIHASFQENAQLTSSQAERLQRLADMYDVDFEDNSLDDVFTLLLRRIDVVPESLVLVQAANESGWGTSRFATEGLNFFGQWCFRKGCGLVPSDRDEDGNHEVAKFASVNASVRSYLRNINTHPAYLELRQIRASYHQNGDQAAATDLTPGLLSYSERREEYIEELNAMIRVNRPLIREVSAVTLAEPLE
ncbi:peptidoglycan hydrolase [Thalassospira xiamenensis]|nr:peptidoglycan hydrolase [Thalassospira xiamenensis]